MKNRCLFRNLVGLLLVVSMAFGMSFYVNDNVYAKEPAASANQTLANAGLVETGTTFAMAQQVAFLDCCYYVVGRWDGTISIFEFGGSAFQGPAIVQAATAPSKLGVEMVASLNPQAFVTSNDAGSLAIWETQSGNWTDLTNTNILSYDSTYGTANRAITTVVSDVLYLVVGHENGFVSIWENHGNQGNNQGNRGNQGNQGNQRKQNNQRNRNNQANQLINNWTFVRSVDVRAANAVNPWNLHNVRGLVEVNESGIIITGSEDGYLTVVDITSGQILNTKLFNPDAQRGINNIAFNENILLVANCSVGPDDYNLWSFVVDPITFVITSADYADLKADSSVAQAYNFDVLFANDGSGRFFSSTEEGILWSGTVDGYGNIFVEAQSVISDRLASSLAMNGNRLIAVAYNLREFEYAAAVPVNLN